MTRVLTVVDTLNLKPSLMLSNLHLVVRARRGASDSWVLPEDDGIHACTNVRYGMIWSKPFHEPAVSSVMCF